MSTAQPLRTVGWTPGPSVRQDQTRLPFSRRRPHGHRSAAARHGPQPQASRPTTQQKTESTARRRFGHDWFLVELRTACPSTPSGSWTNAPPTVKLALYVTSSSPVVHTQILGGSVSEPCFLRQAHPRDG